MLPPIVSERSKMRQRGRESRRGDTRQGSPGGDELLSGPTLPLTEFGGLDQHLDGPSRSRRMQRTKTEQLYDYEAQWGSGMADEWEPLLQTRKSDKLIRGKMRQPGLTR